LLPVFPAVVCPDETHAKIGNFRDFLNFPSFALSNNRAKGFRWYYGWWLLVRWYVYCYGMIILPFEPIDLEKNKNPDRTFYSPIIDIYICIYIYTYTGKGASITTLSAGMD